MPAQPTFRDANRAQLSMLAPLEKKVLIWLAERMPRRVNSDHLTILGFASLVGAGLAYWHAGRDIAALHLVNVFLITNWFGDSLDGTLARVRNRLRPRYGFYVDHVVDMFGTFALIGGMGLSPFMSGEIAVGLIIAYFMLNIEVYLATHTLGTFHLSFFKLSPTEMRILLFIGNVYLLWRPARVTLWGQSFLLFDVGGLIGIAGMALVLLITVVRHTAQLYREETLP